MADAGLQGKVVLVTGATGGIGKVAALELAKLGPELVIVGRDPKRTADAVTEIQSKSGNTNVSALLGDLSLQADVRRVAAEFKAKHERLHVLLNNAGALFHDRQVTAEGFEMTLALNHLAYFTLTQELLPLLKAGAPSRIVNVASDAHLGMKLDFDDLQSARGYTRWKSYGRSKLCNILFTRELAKRLEGSGVTSNCMHPGVVATGFGSGTGFVAQLIKLSQAFMITPEQGADTAVYLCSSPEVEGQSGSYFYKRKPRRSSANAQNMADAARLWTETEKLLGAGPRAATA
jgi:NAD(P)-dependent dehydrogenase (short-subunit alcohol dehydrogenase family)